MTNLHGLGWRCWRAEIALSVCCFSAPHPNTIVIPRGEVVTVAIVSFEDTQVAFRWFKRDGLCTLDMLEFCRCFTPIGVEVSA